jgi:transposase
MVKRQQFTAEFKREAVRQMKVGDKPIAQLSRELGVPRNRLYKWSLAVQAVGEKEAFPGSGRRSSEQAELMRLRRELARTQMELEILKKAEAYFASAPARGTPGSKGSKTRTR